MARQPGLEYAGAIYHVTVRVSGSVTGKEREPYQSECLFRDDSERERFLSRLGERAEAFRIRLCAYCLMLSHYRSYISKQKTPDWLNIHPILAQFERGTINRHRAYRRFVEGALAEKDEEIEMLLKGRNYGVGEEEFQEWMRISMATDVCIVKLDPWSAPWRRVLKIKC
jgi:hypothetical protein